ncbi:MAG: pyruvate kinase [Oscillospiraceae bacterium]|nr:pyruvate kinase [Oscillospiraceae bacterium]
MRKTKIVCTIGPASENEETLRQLILSGMNVARLNFSHGTHDEHAQKIQTLKKLRGELGLPVAIMADTKGVEIRIRTFESGSAALTAGAKFTFTTREVPGSESIVSVNYPGLCKSVRPGGRILVDDGLCEFLILSVTETDVECEVVNGGTLKNRKSVNLPGAVLDIPYLSEADKTDIAFGIEHDVDFFALSFIRSARDVEDVRKFMQRVNRGDIRLIAKIENAEGVDNIDEIIEAADGVMVARGDMGVEIPFEELPYIQKKIISACYRAGKVVITATQMLESMITHPRPTRAEITDVANAVYDGTSAVMLSGETAVGRYPVLALETMVKIAERTEANIDYKNQMDKTFHFADLDASMTNAISHATCATAHSLDAKAIIAVTLSGTTARMISRFRPQTEIIAVTPIRKAYFQLAMSWGVTPMMNTYIEDPDELIEDAVDHVIKNGCVKQNDLVVITGSSRYSAGEINSIQVYVIGKSFGKQ